MIIYNSLEEFNSIKHNLPKLSFVPTMGNLHEGHASLIDIAKKTGNEVVSTIYVNSLQFNDKNDFINYPKTLDMDIELLGKRGCNHLILPDPSILDNIKSIKAPIKSMKLCGAHRPGHFDGVLTILNRLFEIINPHSVVFGKKDYQQFLLVKDFIDEKKLNINIIAANTIRNNNGLALSSRNILLTEKDKLIAPTLYKTLKDIEKNKAYLNSEYLKTKLDYLKSSGFKVDYLMSCDTESLEESYNINNNDLLIAVAAHLGSVRLIDNLVISKL